jgi:Protein of unknown function (DUF1524)
VRISGGRFSASSRHTVLARLRLVADKTDELMSKSNIQKSILLLLVVFIATSCTYFSGQPGGAAQNSTKNVDAGSAETALDGLEVLEPGSMSGYSREKFRHWSKASEFGWDPPQPSCDAREAALIRDGETVEIGSECKVQSGTWLDPYTSQTFTNPSDIDTDHVVPLANAWRSGASEWDKDARERYANDPEVLLSVEDNANQSKGDKGPEAWKPPNEAEWCDYAVRWIGIKDKYDLSVNAQEKEALVEMLDACEGG